MKHKFVLRKDGETGALSIREYAELDKDMFSLVCQASFRAGQLEAAMAQGIEAAIAEMRTENFFPTAHFSEKILQAAVGLVAPDGPDTVEVSCEDAEFLSRDPCEALRFEKLEDDEELDEFLEDDFSDGFDDGVKSGGLTPAIEVDDDAPLDEDET